MPTPVLKPSVDEAFRRRLYNEVHREEFTGLENSFREQLLKQQSDIQEQQYSANYPSLERFTIILQNEAVGIIYLNRSPEETALVNIALLPSFQKKGVGISVMKKIMDEADAASQPIRLSVMQNNPAANWYLKLGFQEIARRIPYIEMLYQHS